MAAGVKKLNKELTGWLADDWNNFFQSLGSGMSDILGLMGSLRSQHIDNEIADLDRALQAQLDAIDAQTQEQLSTLGLTEEEKKRIQEEAAERKEQLEQEEAQKKYQLEVQQFKAEQKFAKAEVWISNGMGIAAAAARAAGMGFIRGPIYMAVMGAFLAAKTGMSLGLINGQQAPAAPSFDKGGVMGGNSFTGDRLQANLNSGEMVLTRERQLQLLNGDVSGGSSITIEQLVLPNVNNGQQLIDEIKKIQRFEAVR